MGKRTKLFIDCEFTHLGHDADLLSIAIVSEDDVYFYAEISDYAENKTTSWVKENVLPSLRLRKGVDDIMNHTNPHIVSFYGTKKEVAEKLRDWLSLFNSVEIWGDVCHYDWVLFCSLFGTAFDIPNNVYYICFDIATFMVTRGVDPDIDRKEFLGIEKGLLKHNSLLDARITKQCYRKLETKKWWLL